jgi:hypothetical protein
MGYLLINTRLCRENENLAVDLGQNSRLNQFFYHFESFLPAFKLFLCYNISGLLKLNRDERGG